MLKTERKIAKATKCPILKCHQKIQERALEEASLQITAEHS